MWVKASVASPPLGSKSPRGADVDPDLPNESLRDVRRKTAGAKSVAPLAGAEAPEEVAGPRRVVRREPLLEQRLIGTPIVELDEPVLHAGDEAAPLEEVHVATARSESAGLAECRAKIADD